MSDTNHYDEASYGRNEEVEAILNLFRNGHDVSMPGPRRLGKTFLLDRIVHSAPKHGWRAIKVEVAGCSSPRDFLRALCQGIERSLGGGSKTRLWITQRAGQVLSPRATGSGSWYSPLLELDHEVWLGRLLGALQADSKIRWAILIDELPIFLKALHDKGKGGVIEARNFMNLTSRLRQESPGVRWLITGSIGIEPLAKEGDYMGVLVKYTPFSLKPLTDAQATSFIQDLATDGRLPRRSRITDAEANAIVAAVGWNAAFYLDAVGRNLSGDPTDDEPAAAELVEAAVQVLLGPSHTATFAIWEEHLRKHYAPSQFQTALRFLGILAKSSSTRALDHVAAEIGSQHAPNDKLIQVVKRLEADGFVTVDSWEADPPSCRFRNPLLRRWWMRWNPKP